MMSMYNWFNVDIDFLEYYFPEIIRYRIRQIIEGLDIICNRYNVRPNRDLVNKMYTCHFL